MNAKRLTKTLDRYVFNGVVNVGAALGIQPFGIVIVETIGRRSGKRRRTPVGGRLDEGGRVWVVAEHGRKADYVRNVEANPRVRVKAKRRWRTGTARLLLEDDWRARLRTMGDGRPGLRMTLVLTRKLATEPLTVRIDLDDSGDSKP